jgi:hypothetical protein
MMHLVGVVLALLAAPFWETKAPRDWTEDELRTLLNDSPWAQPAEPSPAVPVYLATATPMRAAEAERARRRAEQPNDEYLDFLREHSADSIVLAVACPKWTALSDAAESRHMEDESMMKVGRRKFHMTGHFPPTPSDPYLRLIFPREVTAADKSVTFELYLPGNGPYHEAEFRLRDLMSKGKLEM